MFCANADGTHKIPITIIGKSERPLCLRNIAVKLPFDYYGQKSAWMDQIIFTGWFKEVFIPAIKKKHPDESRKILLLLDNAPAHPSTELLNSIDPTIQVYKNFIINSLKNQMHIIFSFLYDFSYR